MTERTLTSSLLIAMPQLQDPNFKRSIILIVQNDENGTFGLVLNREVELEATTLCESLDLRWCGDPDSRIHWGGPVESNTGWILFNEGDEASKAEGVTELAGGLYFAGSLDALRVISTEPPEYTRLFLGYAGWGPGQLEREMSEGAWLTAPVSSDTVFSIRSDRMWEKVLRQIGVDPATLIPTRGVH